MLSLSTWRLAGTVERVSRPRIARKAGYHHGDLRRALLVAAERLIERKGPAQLTLRETAKLAGVSVAAPYRHFADKEALLAAVLEGGFDALASRLSAARLAAPSPQAALVAVGTTYVRFADENRSVYRLMFGSAVDKSRHAALHAAGQAALGELLAAVTACQQAGLLIEAGAHELALSGWALCHGLASLRADGALDSAMPVDGSSAGERLIHFLLHGLLKAR